MKTLADCGGLDQGDSGWVGIAPDPEGRPGRPAGELPAMASGWWNALPPTRWIGMGTRRPRRGWSQNAARAPRLQQDQAFTLLEILLALALTALVLVSLNVFVFSMGELWGRNSDVRLFDRHVRAVTRFLDHELRTAALPPSAVAGK